MVSEKFYDKKNKAKVFPVMSSDDSDIEEIEINDLLEQPFNALASSSTPTVSLVPDTALDTTAFSVIGTVGSGTSSPSAPEVLPRIPTSPLIASPLPKKAAFTSFDESLANPYSLGRKYAF